jgi:hypothetical protein
LEYIRKTTRRLLNVNHSPVGLPLLLLLTWLQPARPADCQSPAVRASINAFRDSLWTITAPDQLRLIERKARDEVKQREEAALELRLGLAIMRRAEVEDGRLFDRARSAFKRADQLQPEWAYPQLGIGWAERGKGDWLAQEPANLGTRVGYGAYQAAVRALLEATGRDPRLVSALMELDRLASILRDSTITRQVLEALRESAVVSEDSRLWLALGRYERSAGSSEKAMKALERYAESGENSDLARLEMARTWLTAGDARGDSVYFEAALSNDSFAIAGLRSDLESVAQEMELSQFDQVEGPERQAFLQKFWNDRARRDLREPGERLREHYRRLGYARKNFSLPINRRYYSLRDLYRAPTNEIDDRGVIYIRHGKPDKLVAPNLYGLLPNESWLYQDPEGDRLIHFSAGGQDDEGGAIEDYRLVASVLDLRGNGTPVDLLLLSRGKLSDLYGKMLNWGPHGADRAAQEERELGESSAATGTTTDGFGLRFDRPLEVRTDLLAIGKTTHPLLQLLYVITETSDSRTPVRARMVFFDSSGSIRAWLDTTVVPERLDSTSRGGRVEVPVPPGRWAYRLALEAGARGKVLPLDTVRVPALASHVLGISSIGLGQNRGSIRWVVGPADTALLNPITEFERNGELQVYYEVYGLEEREPFHTTIAVHDRRGQKLGQSRLRLSFPEEAQGVTTRTRRSIRLVGLEPRDYWLEVTVRDTGGRQVIARKQFSIMSVAH